MVTRHGSEDLCLQAHGARLSKLPLITDPSDPMTGSFTGKNGGQ